MRTRCWTAKRPRSLGKPVGKDSGIGTWEGEQWKTGGGATWGWYAYDPKTNLVFYGSGNPSTWNPVQRPGDNKWSMTIFARDADTGVAKWVYQMTPHDEWDYDGVNEMILVDGMDVDGAKHDVLVHFDRNGFAYTMDRNSGELLVAKKYDPKVNWATEVVMDPASDQYGRPQVVAKYSTQQNGEDTNTSGICPAALGTKDQQPAAYSPKTGLFYVPTNHVCMDYEPYQGQLHRRSALCRRHACRCIRLRNSHGGMGNFIAWDAAKGEIVWSIPEQFSVWSGALATAGDVVFYGTLEGYIKAVDTDRQGTVQVQDPVGHHRQRQHLRAWRQAVHRRPLGRRRLGRHRPCRWPACAGKRGCLARRGRRRAVSRATKPLRSAPPVSARSAAMPAWPNTPRSAVSSPCSVCRTDPGTSGAPVSVEDPAGSSNREPGPACRPGFLFDTAHAPNAALPTVDSSRRRNEVRYA